MIGRVMHLLGILQIHMSPFVTQPIFLRPIYTESNPRCRESIVLSHSF